MVTKQMYEKSHKKEKNSRANDYLLDDANFKPIMNPLTNCIQLLLRTEKNERVLDQVFSELIVAIEWHKLGGRKAEIVQILVDETGADRSTIYRRIQRAQMEFDLDIPVGKVREYVFRQLRKIAEEKYWVDIMEEALEIKGSHEKITAKDIYKIAKKRGYLKAGLRDSKEMADTNKAHQNSKSMKKNDRRPTGNAPKRSDATRKLDERKLQDYPEFKGILSEIRASKSETTWVRKYLEQSYVNAGLIEELENLTLNQRQSLLRLLP